MFMPRLLPDGAYADLITPFSNGEVDHAGLASLIEYQIQSGMTGLVVCGENSEAYSLTHDERVAVIRTAVAAAKGAVPVLVGTGTNCTRSSLELTLHAKALGADAALLVAPFYSKPSQKGLLAHIKTVAEAVDLPLVIVNCPARSAVDITPDLAEALACVPSVVGLVDCTGDVTRLTQVSAACRARIHWYSGHDRSALAFTLAGGHGGFSLSANIAPRQVASMHNAFRYGNIAAACVLQERLLPLFAALDLEHPVAAAKQALSLIRCLTPELRLPLTPVGDEAQALIRTAITLLGNHSVKTSAKAS
ncbi:4-hydroxy-tetrahydrodipicolinate synthase [Agrobacterium vitis]|uniref:4-hydroxy-tetrahydrodipicolinate synthase n=2 Tax=Agrobacterium vitis TaxID=373 RepID=UPI0012E8D41D|nr:4-hydroxy-tetrahydrodipicolinate synthase [Agrobacterium vitis]MVA63569.1 4-hydroxy-tetrahydrodipicolinate synthase [Agrobacterium vitis]